MKTNSNPRKVVPMSTKVINLWKDAYIFILWVIFLNPLSMYVINLFKPKLASALAHNSLFCGKDMQLFYQKLATKGKFKRAKWWLSPEDLKNYTPDEQAIYFLMVNDSQETLNALTDEACLFLIQNHPDRLKDTIKERKLNTEMFKQLLNSPLLAEIQSYIKKGTLPKEQLALLLDAAVQDSHTCLQSMIMSMVLEYIERCGISKDLFQKYFKNQGVGAGFAYAAQRAQRCYDQRIKVLQYRNLETEKAQTEWAEYLKKEGKLYVNPSIVMSLKQYQIFHEVGLLLRDEAILHFLKKDNQKMIEAIFRLEPNHGIANEEIGKLVNDTPELNALYKLATR